MRGLVVVALLACIAVCAGSSGRERYDKGKKAMAASEYGTALEHFHAACDAEPNNYEYFNMRAILYLAMGRLQNAVRDLSTVLALKPTLTKVRAQRADLLLKQGRFDEARADFNALPSSPEVEEQKRQLESASVLTAEAKRLFEKGDCANVVSLLTQAVETATSDGDSRMMRGQCYEKLGQIGEAIGDLTRATKLKNDNIPAYFQLSNIQYNMGEIDDSLKNIRECLKLDPDHKPCFDLYSKIKKFSKLFQAINEQMSQQRYADALKQLEKARKIEQHVFHYVNIMKTQTCEAHANLGQHAEALNACTDALTYNSQNVDALIGRAKAHELNQEYERAIEDLKQAKQLQNDNQKVNDALGRNEKLLKQSKKRDYYKILDVPRNADKGVIMKAYRKLAMIYHPDKYEKEEEKKEAEKKFMDIAAAKEVLTDPQKRAIFDQGDDPLDAESERDRQQQGFHHHQHPFFQQGGQQFHFKFN
eukprot:m.886329 g.886329  ORF g.886329 m.886329 type:complete len:476 (-) comp59908_c0_seq3:6619-8046(-)